MTRDLQPGAQGAVVPVLTHCPKHKLCVSLPESDSQENPEGRNWAWGNCFLHSFLERGQDFPQITLGFRVDKDWNSRLLPAAQSYSPQLQRVPVLQNATPTGLLSLWPDWTLGWKMSLPPGSLPGAVWTSPPASRLLLKLPNPFFWWLPRGGLEREAFSGQEPLRPLSSPPDPIPPSSHICASKGFFPLSFSSPCVAARALGGVGLPCPLIYRWRTQDRLQGITRGRFQRTTP